MFKNFNFSNLKLTIINLTIFLCFQIFCMRENYDPARLQQVKELLLIKAGQHNQQKDTIENLINLIKPLTDPYFIYINIAQLQDTSSKFIYFYAYRMGREKILLWGSYNRITKNINIAGGCKYNNLALLNSAIKIWNSKGFAYVFGEVKNKSTNLISLYLYLENMTPDQYFKQKNLIALLRNEIDLKDYLSEGGTQEEIEKFKEEINQKAQKEEWNNIDETKDFILDKYEENLEKNLPESTSNKAPFYKHKVIYDYNDYKKLKANIALARNIINQDQYKVLYPIKTYEKFIQKSKNTYSKFIKEDKDNLYENFIKKIKSIYTKNIDNMDKKNRLEDYLNFLEEKVIEPYEETINRIDIIKNINQNLFDEMNVIAQKLLNILSGQEIARSKIISNSCPSFEYCMENQDAKSCGLYLYGISIKDPEDNDLS